VDLGKIVFRAIGVQLVHKIGFIGYKNQALRIREILEKIENCSIEKIFHPTKLIDSPQSTTKISDLYNCDSIFILSPNQTHFEYIDNLMKNFDGYIFCEKPPVTNENELTELVKLPQNDKERLFFNFNFRFSKISEILKTELETGKIGKINFLSFVSTHGLAFKEEYLNSWRANGERNLHNILDTVAIHYLDLVNYIFKKISKTVYLPYISSGYGTSYDTCDLVLKSNSITVNIHCSYAAPKVNEMMIIGTNGVITVRDNALCVHLPRDTFDSRGFFKEPPLVQKDDFCYDSEYHNSLVKAVKFFVSCVNDKKPINVKYFDSSLQTTKLLIDLKSRIN